MFIWQEVELSAQRQVFGMSSRGNDHLSAQWQISVGCLLAIHDVLTNPAWSE